MSKKWNRKLGTSKKEQGIITAKRKGGEDTSNKPKGKPIPSTFEEAVAMGILK